MESICECKYNYIFNNEIIEENYLLQNTLGFARDILSNSNLDVLKCFKDVFKKENIKKSYGGFIIIGIFIFEVIFSILFIFNDMDKIQKYIYNTSEKYISITINENKTMKKKKVKHFKKNIKHKIKEPTKKRKKKKKKKEISQSTKILINQNFTSQKINIYFNKNYNFHTKFKTDNEQNYFNMEQYFKKDLDDMDYDDAIKYDNRKFCEYFFSQIKENQMIVKTFYNNENIIPKSIKIVLLLLSFQLYFVIDGLFYSEEYIIKLYHLEEDKSFFSYIPRSISRFFYSILVSYIIRIIIDCFFIEEKKIKKILMREKENILQLRFEIANTIKSIKKRYITFIFICFFIGIFSWYYVSCFNFVYKNVKIEWIKSSITVIFIIQLLTVIFSFLSTILREISFKCKSEKVFKLKQYI